MNLVDGCLSHLQNKLNITEQNELKKFEHLITVTNQAYLKIAINEFVNIKK